MGVTEQMLANQLFEYKNQVEVKAVFIPLLKTTLPFNNLPQGHAPATARNTPDVVGQTTPKPPVSRKLTSHNSGGIGVPGGLLDEYFHQRKDSFQLIESRSSKQ